MIAFVDFLKKCPICTFCICKKRVKEGLILDPDEIIEKELEEDMKPKTPPESLKNTTFNDDTKRTESSPEPSFEEESEEEEDEKPPTPEESKEEEEVYIGPSNVLVRDPIASEHFHNEAMGETFANTQQLGLVN